MCWCKVHRRSTWLTYHMALSSNNINLTNRETKTGKSCNSGLDTTSWENSLCFIDFGFWSFRVHFITLKLIKYCTVLNGRTKPDCFIKHPVIRYIFWSKFYLVPHIFGVFILIIIIQVVDTYFWLEVLKVLFFHWPPRYLEYYSNTYFGHIIPHYSHLKLWYSNILNNFKWNVALHYRHLLICDFWYIWGIANK